MAASFSYKNCRTRTGDKTGAARRVEVTVNTAERKGEKMISEGIKSLMGEDLTRQVEAALRGKGKEGKDIDLVIGNDGSFVPVEKYNSATGGRTSAENALKAAAEALKELGGGGDPTKIADDVKTAQKTLAELRTKHEREIKRIGRNAALKTALNGKVHDPADVIGLLELDKIEVDDNGDLKTDLEGLLKPIRETKPYLFKEQSKTAESTIKGVKPAQSGASTSQATRADGPVVL